VVEYANVSGAVLNKSLIHALREACEVASTSRQRRVDAEPKTAISAKSYGKCCSRAGFPSSNLKIKPRLYLAKNQTACRIKMQPAATRSANQRKTLHFCKTCRLLLKQQDTKTSSLNKKFYPPQNKG
jgi:hypothetical protein